MGFPGTAFRKGGKMASTFVAEPAESSPLAPLTDLLPSGQKRRQQTYERVIRTLLTLVASIAVVITLGVVASLVQPTVRFFQDVSFGDFFGSTKWYPLF